MTQNQIVAKVCAFSSEISLELAAKRSADSSRPFKICSDSQWEASHPGEKLTVTYGDLVEAEAVLAKTGVENYWCVSSLACAPLVVAFRRSDLSAFFFPQD